MWNVECGIVAFGDFECGMWNVELSPLAILNVECGVLNVELRILKSTLNNS